MDKKQFREPGAKGLFLKVAGSMGPPPCRGSSLAYLPDLSHINPHVKSHLTLLTLLWESVKESWLEGDGAKNISIDLFVSKNPFFFKLPAVHNKM